MMFKNAYMNICAILQVLINHYACEYKCKVFCCKLWSFVSFIFNLYISEIYSFEPRGRCIRSRTNGDCLSYQQIQEALVIYTS